MKKIDTSTQLLISVVIKNFTSAFKKGVIIKVHTTSFNSTEIIIVRAHLIKVPKE